MIPPIILFGSSRFSFLTAKNLEARGFLPSLIVTKPDSKAGRGLSLTPPEIKLWAMEKNIPVLQSEKINTLAEELEKRKGHIFLIASFRKIIPESLLSIPERGWLNIHPSLLPKYRGPSPIISQVLEGEKNVGVSIMLLDEKVDHGKVFARKETALSSPLSALDLEEQLAKMGANLFTEILPSIVSGELIGETQDESQATYTKKFSKEDGLLEVSENDEKNYRKYLALGETIGTYFFVTRKNGEKKRVVIRKAVFENNIFIPTRVVPEGGKEMDYQDFLRGL
ncbi:MAG: methionyl-tRNA formyltransferase [Patescibacteria group bacterium]